MVEDPDAPPADENDTNMEGLGLAEVMLITWILQKRALDGSKLVTSIEKGPCGVYFFCTNEEKKLQDDVLH
eukprot:13939058-Ditylum_brightwellii.AAC.1